MASNAFTRSMTEADMLAAFQDLAKAGGGRLWHIRDARGQQVKDMPDVILAVPPVLAAFELKTQRDMLSPGQRDALAILARCEVVVSGIVRPEPKTEDELTLDQALSKIVGARPDLWLGDEGGR